MNISSFNRHSIYKNAQAIGLALLSVLIVSTASWAKNYYVDAAKGNDSSPGTLSSPWKTVQKGANVAVAGDTVYVRKGTYKEKVTVKNSGSSGKPIVFMAYPGETPILDGTGISLSGYKGLFTAENKNYITLDGFHVRNSAEVLVRMAYGTGFVLRNCRIHTNRASNTDGVFFKHVTNSFIENNDVSNTKWDAINVISSSNVKIRYNYVHDNVYHAGINIFPATNEAQVTYSGNDVMYNVVTRIVAGAAIYTRYQTNNTIAYNLIYDNTSNAIKFDEDRCYAKRPAGSKCNYVYRSNTKVHNNTLVYNGKHGIMNVNATHTDIKNNIIAFNGSSPISVNSKANTGHSIDYNMYYSPTNSNKRANEINSNPLFIDANKGNFDLKSTSLGWKASNTGSKVGAAPVPTYANKSDGSIQPLSPLSPPSNLRLSAQ